MNRTPPVPASHRPHPCNCFQGLPAAHLGTSDVHFQTSSLDVPMALVLGSQTILPFSLETGTWPCPAVCCEWIKGRWRVLTLRLLYFLYLDLSIRRQLQINPGTGVTGRCHAILNTFITFPIPESHSLLLLEIIK